MKKQLLVWGFLIPDPADFNDPQVFNILKMAYLDNEATVEEKVPCVSVSQLMVKYISCECRK